MRDHRLFSRAITYPFASQTDRSGIFIGCKGRRFTIHKSVYGAQVVLPPFLHPSYIHYPFRGLSKGGHWHAHSLSLSLSLNCLWDLQVTLPVTPRKLGLTTLTGPNCFLPAIRPWPTLLAHGRPRKISRYRLHNFLISSRFWFIDWFIVIPILSLTQTNIFKIAYFPHIFIHICYILYT